ncbi:HAD family hydrolase [Ilumatobacter sp.]|uniref:HAD family hydrolase n=1 Tax=Ilumatobacter sp. TaxID=1967498 RepID=UPI003AF4C88E
MPEAVRADRFEVVGFDADDTLWRSEDDFQQAEAMFAELVAPHAPDGIDVLDALHATEAGNIAISGYGVKAFALSMVQAAVTATSGRVPATVIGQLVDHAHDLLMQPVELLDGVPETLAAVGRTHRLVLITKGDLVHQTRKIRTSGIEHHFEHVGVVLEKDPDTYRRTLQEWSVDPATFLFVGNSVRSDMLPVIEIGGAGVHVPYHVTWAHEVVRDHDGDFADLGSIRELPGWLAGGD